MQGIFVCLLTIFEKFYTRSIEVFKIYKLFSFWNLFWSCMHAATHTRILGDFYPANGI